MRQNRPGLCGACGAEGEGWEAGSPACWSRGACAQKLALSRADAAAVPAHPTLRLAPPPTAGWRWAAWPAGSPAHLQRGSSAGQYCSAADHGCAWMRLLHKRRAALSARAPLPRPGAPPPSPASHRARSARSRPALLAEWAGSQPHRRQSTRPLPRTRLSNPVGAGEGRWHQVGSGARPAGAVVKLAWLQSGRSSSQPRQLLTPHADERLEGAAGAPVEGWHQRAGGLQRGEPLSQEGPAAASVPPGLP